MPRAERASFGLRWKTEKECRRIAAGRSGCDTVRRDAKRLPRLLGAWAAVW
ncbi:hypothetical protein BSIN_0124 [Burkholderia singularis]|uniref:Uncharacterized protein n=1 Tax=Burkholderia singularis TaxID=1503053 RepID=A0A238H2B3_9BURK|nr:hypothetical protein BSIN_0124 [Burkholderia singularis]